MVMIFIINTIPKKTLLDYSSFHMFFPPLFPCTLGTQTEDIQFVALLNVTILFHKLILNSLQLRAVNFLEPAARQANQMIVVLVAVFMFESLRPISEIDLPAHARFAHQLDRPGHRRIADPSVFFSDQIVQSLNGQMLFRGQEHIQHVLPLHGASQALSGDKLLELFFCIHFARTHRIALLTNDASIANRTAPLSRSP